MRVAEAPRACGFALLFVLVAAASTPAADITMNEKDTGYRGIWYMNQPSGDQYVFKYSGGLGTYCAKHRPFAVYSPEAKKTFFCYGGTRKDSHTRHAAQDLRKGALFERRRTGFLLHMVSCYDHETGMVPRPTIVLDKETADAHDNPVISLDDKGYIWIFSTSHGTTRPSYIHRSRKPYDIDEFELIHSTRREGDKRVPIDNFSYMQPWHSSGRGFIAFFTKYNYPAVRTLCFMTSPDGADWSEWKRLATIEDGHYQISIPGKRRAGTAFNYHLKGKGANGRTNLYYMETEDLGRTWRTAAGKTLTIPLSEVRNDALVRDYRSEGLYIYLKDICYDAQDRPVILYLTSRGFGSGPVNDPRTWTTARWTGAGWDIRPVTTSDSNYDTGSIYVEDDGTWRIIGPTETGPQPGNPGGEIAVWTSTDLGRSWQKTAQLTSGSERNHTYVRRPLNAHPGFYALWADGDGRKPSKSSLYFCDIKGNTYLLPEDMTGNRQKPLPMKQPVSAP